ncbi:MAG: anhydro-N-acetylmuramic acid kinase [Bacteroidia bacterium]|nr:anhydro-N-acetylmuramic acid kinase [Bacteroidia bacterium]MDW8348153.1 anhydro-N-acetylmuramic acid kinase [Bacteroidia bacterium]
MRTWYAVGLMSGTSLDGLDICYVRFSNDFLLWKYDIIDATTYHYSEVLIQKLKNAHTYSVEQIASLDHELGLLWGEYLKQKNYPIIDFVASHGHTVLHNPKQGYTLQIGNPADIAAIIGVPVVADFRRLDVALKGNGAPLVPCGEKYLFNSIKYPIFLNLGGIANFSFHPQYSKEVIASDLVFVNIAINDLTQQFFNTTYDKNGHIAQQGKIISELFQELEQWHFLLQSPPKSLGREQYEKEIKPILESYFSFEIENVLHTYYHFVAKTIAKSIKELTKVDLGQQVFVTGGGAHNVFLMDCIQNYGRAHNIFYFLPDPVLIDYKEALVFAFLGLMRWIHQKNTINNVTGAVRNAVTGAIWTP